MTGSSRDRVALEAFDGAGLTRSLKELVQIPSVTGSENEIAQYLARTCEGLGLTTVVAGKTADRPSVVARLKGRRPGPSLVLHAHIDTVPVGDVNRWTFPPLGGVVSDGRIYGRGTSDTKHCIAAGLEVARILQHLKADIAGELILMMPSGEEGGPYKGTAYLLEQGIVESPDYVVIGEQTELQIGTAHKAPCRIRLTARGTAAHASRAGELGVNAIFHLVRVLNALEQNLLPQLAAVQAPPLGSPTLNAGLISGGTASNIVPELAEAVIDLRVVPEFDLPLIVDQIQLQIQLLQAADPTVDVQISIEHRRTPYVVPETDPLVVQMKSATKRALGVESASIGYKPGSDAFHFATRGIYPIIFGGGSLDQPHTADEFIALTQLEGAARTLLLLVTEVLDARWKGVPQP